MGQRDLAIESLGPVRGLAVMGKRARRIAQRLIGCGPPNIARGTC